MVSFSRLNCRAHLFARLRIAQSVAGLSARLATDLGGLTLGRAGFAPAGRQTRFPEVIASSFLLDQPFLVAPVLQNYPLLFRRSDEYQALSKLIQQVLLVGIAAELGLLLMHHRTAVAVEVIVFVIARKMVNPDTTVVELLLSVVALCMLIVVRCYFLSGKPR